MFEKEYKEAMNIISADTKTKEDILLKLSADEQKRERRNPAIPWRIGFAAVAVVAIVIGMLFVPKKTLFQSKSDVTALTAAKSYNDIYKIFRNKKIASRWNNIFEYTTDEEIELFDYNDIAMPGLTNGTATGTTDTGTTESKKDDYSTTTEQVEGVSEADIVKTDGEYIYYLNTEAKKINVFSADKENSKLINQIELPNDAGVSYGEMFLKDDRLIILQTNYMYYALTDSITDETSSYSGNYNNYVSIIIYDTSNPDNIKQISCVRQQGWYNTARMVGDYFYLVSNCNIDVFNVEKDKPESFVPTVICNDTMQPVPVESIYRYDDDIIELPQYAVICSYKFTDGTLLDTASILGGTDQIYCSTGNIILTKAQYHDIAQQGSGVSDTTMISKLEIANGSIKYKASGEIDGTLENQFFIDEYNEHFRFITTVTSTTTSTTKFANSDEEIMTYSSKTSARLTILDNNLEKVGEIKDLAPDERVYSVRFMGDVAYFVTFRQVDPLFSADLSDPTNPKIIGELKIPGFSEYMYPYGDGKLLGFGRDADETTGRAGDLKLSMFDINNPADVTENDKTVIDGYVYSEALYDHKAMLVSVDRNLIGFIAHDRYGNSKYLIYQYIDGGFARTATLHFSDKYYCNTRGLYVGDGFYVVTNENLKVFDMKTFLEIANIEL